MRQFLADPTAGIVCGVGSAHHRATQYPNPLTYSMADSSTKGVSATTNSETPQGKDIVGNGLPLSQLPTYITHLVDFTSKGFGVKFGINLSYKLLASFMVKHRI